MLLKRKNEHFRLRQLIGPHPFIPFVLLSGGSINSLLANNIKKQAVTLRFLVKFKSLLTLPRTAGLIIEAAQASFVADPVNADTLSS